jgi:hypothetical protein
MTEQDHHLYSPPDLPKFNLFSHSDPKPPLLEEQTRKLDTLQSHIIVLQQAIDEELYSLELQDKLYEYLLGRMSGKPGKHQPQLNAVVEKAVDFMDAGEEFAREMGKLRAMGKWR